jgi:penicillin amidase
MRIFGLLMISLIQWLFLGAKSLVKIPGLKATVQISRDSSGINHIVAQNEHDLFFMQGYCAARDRLFQLEIWRRQATGTLSQIVGEREILRDKGARLFKFRGNLQQELNHYHPRGAAIINAFTDGINQYIKEVIANKSLLPIEFEMLGIVPGLWTSDVVISRHQGLLANVTDEVRFARAVINIGADKVKQLIKFDSGNPDLTIEPLLPASFLTDPVLETYEAFRKPIYFLPSDIVTKNTTTKAAAMALNQIDFKHWESADDQRVNVIGSNNWVISGKHTQSGFPIVANDPHRAVTIPSLRYAVHLKAPGWDVIGGGEPSIPGVSIGHNQQAAWGLTIFNLDAEDMYVYSINPNNPLQYKYNNKWVDVTIIKDTIPVKNKAAEIVTLYFTKHGPVTFIDTAHKVLYAVRCAWLEVGGAPYLASLRMDQATDWESFRTACSYSNIPGENMVWADKKGNIGWQVAGIAPIRKASSGLVPVSGEGACEWAGMLPGKELPHLFNPPIGRITTANENNVPTDYIHRNAVGWNWADSFRVNRIRQVLLDNPKSTIQQSAALQTDYLSLPAKQLIPLLKDIHFDDHQVDSLKNQLLLWDCRLITTSSNAAVYVLWERILADWMWNTVVPQKGKPYIRSIPLSRIIALLKTDNTLALNRNDILKNTFTIAIAQLKKKIGTDVAKWVYGQADFHHVQLKHVLSNVVNETVRSQLNMPLMPRGGYANTPGATGNTDGQLQGATFRMVADVSNWDKSIFTNAAGQSGNSASPLYRNLYLHWANDQYQPLVYTFDAIKKITIEKEIFQPTY